MINKNEKLISIIFKSDFGFFRKPDFNNTLNLSYNLIHKPCILGILGAIIGLNGFKKKGILPEYYKTLKHIPIGIKPLNDNNGNYNKTEIIYTNTIGYANAGSNLILKELTLIKPAFEIYLLLDINNEIELKIFNYLQKGEAEYIPYFGKNEFHCWFNKNDFKVYEFNKVDHNIESFNIDTIFVKDRIINDIKEEIPFDIDNINTNNNFIYFERLPFEYDEVLFQYKFLDFAYTNFKIQKEYTINNLYRIKNQNGTFLNVQLN